MRLLSFLFVLKSSEALYFLSAGFERATFRSDSVELNWKVMGGDYTLA